MDFVAIDFETACQYRTSVCSLGLAVVENDKIIETKYWLIKPYPEQFNDFNISIHGIHPEDVENAPTFAELWPELKPYIENKLIVAHNTAFDISCLRRTLEHYEIDIPYFQFACTYRIAKLAMPCSGSYRLNMLCQRFGIELNHHNALSDTIACAKLMLLFASNCGAATITDLENEYGFTRGCVGTVEHECFYNDELIPYIESVYEPLHINAPHPVAKQKSKAPKKTSISDDDFFELIPDDDFIDKKFVFTGTLLSMQRSIAEKIVVTGGGTTGSSVTKDTNYLVLGLQDLQRLNGHSESGKTLRARELQAKGFPIQIIGEDEFVSMIDDELYHKIIG